MEVVQVMDHYDMCMFLGTLVVHSMLLQPLVLPVMLDMIKSPNVDEFDLSDLALRLVMTVATLPASDLLIMFQKKFPGVQVEAVYGLAKHIYITLTHHHQQQQPMTCPA
jgi:hypothetical protein